MNCHGHSEIGSFVFWAWNCAKFPQKRHIISCIETLWVARIQCPWTDVYLGWERTVQSEGRLLKGINARSPLSMTPSCKAISSKKILKGGMCGLSLNHICGYGLTQVTDCRIIFWGNLCIFLCLGNRLVFYAVIYQISRAVNPPRHQIVRIDRDEMIDDVISHEKWRHLCQKCSLIPIDVYST